MKKRLFYLVFILGFFNARAQFESHYKIYSKAQHKEVSLEELIKATEGYQVIFFGENHDDSIGHYLEKTIFEKIINLYPQRAALSMEMFERDVQGVMNEYLAGFIQEKHLIKEGRAWSNYRDYKPMVELAKKAGAPVICANTPNRYVNLAGRKGQEILQTLPKTSLKYLPPLPYDTAQGDYLQKLREIFGLLGHDTGAKSSPMAMMKFQFIQSQCLWDAGMGYSISEHLKKNKNAVVFQVNGRFHSDEGFAAVQQVKKYAPKVRSMVISSGYEDDFANPDWTKYEKLGDFVILTDPNVPRTYK